METGTCLFVEGDMFVICCFLRSCLPSRIFRCVGYGVCESVGTHTHTHPPASTAGSAQQKLGWWQRIGGLDS